MNAKSQKLLSDLARYRSLKSNVKKLYKLKGIEKQEQIRQYVEAKQQKEEADAIIKQMQESKQPSQRQNEDEFYLEDLQFTMKKLLSNPEFFYEQEMLKYNDKDRNYLSKILNDIVRIQGKSTPQIDNIFKFLKNPTPALINLDDNVSVANSQPFNEIYQFPELDDVNESKAQKDSSGAVPADSESLFDPVDYQAIIAEIDMNPDYIGDSNAKKTALAKAVKAKYKPIVGDKDLMYVGKLTPNQLKELLKAKYTFDQAQKSINDIRKNKSPVKGRVISPVKGRGVSEKKSSKVKTKSNRLGIHHKIYYALSARAGNDNKLMKRRLK